MKVYGTKCEMCELDTELLFRGRWATGRSWSIELCLECARRCNLFGSLPMSKVYEEVVK